MSNVTVVYQNQSGKKVSEPMGFQEAKEFIADGDAPIFEVIVQVETNSRGMKDTKGFVLFCIEEGVGFTVEF